MAWILSDLIKASGYAGTSGQSFKNNVIGATSGTKMSDYKITNASWDSQTFSGLQNTPYSFTATLTLTEGASAKLFRTAGCLVLTGADSAIISSTVTNSNTVTAQIQTTGRRDLSGAGIASAFTTPSSPFGTPGAGGSPQTVHFILSVNSTASGDDFLGCTIALPRPNMGYPFNTFGNNVDGIVSGSYIVDIRRRAPDITDYDFEWYSDSLFTTFYDSGSNVIWTQSSVGQDKTLWYRWRLKPAINGGNTTWNQVSTGVTFTDNR